MWGGISDFLTSNRRREDDRPARADGSGRSTVPSPRANTNVEAIQRGQSSSGSFYDGSEGKTTLYNEEVSTIAGATASIDGSSRSSNRSNLSQSSFTEVIHWDDLWLGHRIQPYRGKAHCVDDIRLVSCLLEMLDLSDVEGDTVKLLLRSLKFLRLCDYSVEDICSILAHASAYFLDTYAICGAHMDASEVGNVLVTLMFVAHCYVQDETCPLYVWHQHLLLRYCPLSTLNAAIMRLLEIRRYVLRLETQDLKYRFDHLLDVVHKRGGQPEGQRARAISSPSCSHIVSPASTRAADGSTVLGTSPAASTTASGTAPATPASSMGTHASKSIGTSPAVSTTFDVGYPSTAALPCKATAEFPVTDDPSSRVTTASYACGSPIETAAHGTEVSPSSGREAPKTAGADLLSKVLDHFKYQSR